MTEPVLEVEDLTVQYQTSRGMLTAVSDATFSIDEKEYFGIVGESGCGKSTLTKSIIGALADNGSVTSGEIRYKGEDISELDDKELSERIRWKEISYIPQSSMNSLDPLQTIEQKAWELAKTHTDWTESEAIDTFRDMLDIVGISETRLSDYPHQLSGGMQQRVIIALALFLEPSLIIADEPTTALDVIMQDQVFKYLDRIRELTDTSLVLISHDISVVFESCDSMAIMHGGQIAETGSTTDLYDDPRHPYTVLLQRAFTDLSDIESDLETIDGTPPQLFGEVNSCTFADRCPLATEDCRTDVPPSVPVGAREPGDQHVAACIHTNKIDQLRAPPRSIEGGD
jgi:oligopeptide/dipeptide ABC transporter ATP-binding protein